jgi:ribosomal protein S18 acetylase RimI-like enzyme
MGDGVHIRKFRRGDFDAYVDLLMLTSQEEYSNMGRQEVAQMLRQMDKKWIWVAEINKRVAGYLTAEPEHGMLHVIWLDVHPDFQRRGVGTALLHEIILAGKNTGIGPVIVEVLDTNVKGLGFYGRHGFRKRKWYQNYYGNGLSAYEMVKDI